MLAVGLLAGSASAGFVPGQLETRSLEWGGAVRSYDVYQPAVDVPPAGLPVVFDFHGFGSTKEQQRTVLNSELQELSDSQHFLMVWPQGIGNAWNAGTCCTADDRDDVGFVAAILDAVAGEAPLDTSRIYATGLSNGAAMSHRLACDSDDLFAAVVPVAFPIPFAPLSGCQPTRPIAVGMVMGLTDTVVPYVGGFGDARDSFSHWRDSNGCGTGDADAVTLLAGASKPLQRCEAYTSCAEGVEVQLCSVVGTAFTGIPGLEPFAGHLLYFNDSGLNVASETWGFLSRFQHPDPPLLPAPEPGAGALHAAALAVLLGLRRARARSGPSR